MLAGYKTLLEVRKLRAELLERKMPAHSLKGIDDWAEQHMEETIKKAVPEVLDRFYKGTDKGRRNELANELTFSMRMIAARVDRGFNVEVRVAAPANSPEPPSEGESDVQQYVELIEGAAETLKFLKPEGPPILALPETTEPGDQKAPTKEKKGKTE